jgi:hypothetical protein
MTTVLAIGYLPLATIELLSSAVGERSELGE